MKGNIRNKKLVATVMTQARLSGTNPDAAFHKKVASRMLYDRYNRLSIEAQNREHPPAKFFRISLPDGKFFWKPTNKSGEEYLHSLTSQEFDEFIHHEAPIFVPKSERPESKRIPHGQPIKALPRGVREEDYFSSDDGSVVKDRSGPTFAKAVQVDVVDDIEHPPMSPEAICALQDWVTGGGCGKQTSS
jgi:hypothetical protein